MDRKRIIGIIGDANLHGDEVKRKLAFDLGKLIIDNGYRLASGGLGGVMRSASEGARDSERYHDGLIIGMVPTYDPSSANEFIDISIPTGMGVARNVLLASMCDAVIALGGGSGTLSEISLAWQMKKLIVAIDYDGWSKNIGEIQLDTRRNDRIYSAHSPNEAVAILNEKIDAYGTLFEGVGKPRMSEEEAKEKIISIFESKKLRTLGSGKEGFVFSDEGYVYKLIDASPLPIEQYWILLSLSEDVKQHSAIHIPRFDVRFSDPLIAIRYQYKPSNTFDGEHEKKMISLLRELKRLGWIFTNMNPSNLRIITNSGEVQIVDIGRSFIPYSLSLFRKMAMRAFITCRCAATDSIISLLSETNTSEDFSSVNLLGIDPIEFKRNFEIFFQKAINIDKKDVLNPIINRIIQSKPDISSVFDYGSGHGDISKMVQDSGIKVVSYDPDVRLYEQFRESNYKDITFLAKSEMEGMVKDGKEFDTVICSLVLCHPLAGTQEERDQEIRSILRNVRSLSKKYAIIVICNPLYSYVRQTSLQKRTLPNDFSYHEEMRITKFIHSSNNSRDDFHRPLSYYENEFQKAQFIIQEIHQTPGENRDDHLDFYSDFMIFLLEVCDEEN